MNILRAIVVVSSVVFLVCCAFAWQASVVRIHEAHCLWDARVLLKDGHPAAALALLRTIPQSPTGSRDRAERAAVEAAALVRLAHVPGRCGTAGPGGGAGVANLAATQPASMLACRSPRLRDQPDTAHATP
jgi:hypothetical protein